MVSGRPRTELFSTFLSFLSLPAPSWPAYHPDAMNLALSDLLTCPRCGPAHGLILLPDEVRGRRLVAGVLGCPNCRERYVIRDGVADLRVPGEGPPGAGEETPAGTVTDGEEPVVRLAALLGLESAAGVVAVAGPAARHSAGLARLLDDVEVVAIGTTEDPAEQPSGAVSRILVTGRLPFRDAALAGLALTGTATALLEEGARVARPAARMLLQPVAADVRARALAAGTTIVLDAGDTLVVARER
jgi:uncharacterized protein YbaR (Trm112 family)